MDYEIIRTLVENKNGKTFEEASLNIQDVIFSASCQDVILMIKEIGIIPEYIQHDSTEEKLYTKASDILFAKALRDLGLVNVEVNRTRSDCADISASSKYHSYSLIGDAKAFRLSRTAKNAKDFKINSMKTWKGKNDYSILVCPYFQYPKSTSRLYREALDTGVCLFSWEILCLMLKLELKETKDLSFANIWNQSHIIGENCLLADSKNNFFEKQDKNICKILGISNTVFDGHMSEMRAKITDRGKGEIDYYENMRREINGYDRETAIKKLIQTLKIDSKIKTIKKTIDFINGNK